MYKSKYRQQKRNAQDRGIEFYFTYKEWCSWWEKHLGHGWMKKRGHFAHQYVMARYYDDGPYVAHNVKCITASANASEIQSNKKKRFDMIRHIERRQLSRR